MSSANNTDATGKPTKKTICMRDIMYLVFNVITIIVVILTLAAGYGGLKSDVVHNTEYIEKTNIVVERNSSKIEQIGNEAKIDSKNNAVQFAQIQTDLQYIKTLLLELRDK